MRNDMTNLLNSTEIATIFLDDRATAAPLHGARHAPVQADSGRRGRSLADIVSALDYGQPENDTHEVLRTLVFVERLSPRMTAAGWRVRIMPYRTMENMIDGVVMTFIDVTETKRLEADLQRSSRD